LVISRELWLTLSVDLQTAADRLGVHYQTAYRWVRDGSLPAVKRGSIYDIDDDELERFQRRRSAPAKPPTRAHVRSWPHQVERLYALLIAGDELGARQIVDRLREGAIEPLDLCEELFGPALRQLGLAWEEGRLSVAEEHRASAICERLLARLAVHPRGRPRGVCVVGTPSHEEHSLPASMAAVVLRADRWQVHHLGTQVPTPDLIDLVRALQANLVVLSLTNTEALATSELVSEQIRDNTDATVLVGAPGSTLRDLVAEARRVS
jgi:MerR family transcriptional regulator, light-induced transcriptional regulator